MDYIKFNWAGSLDIDNMIKSGDTILTEGSEIIIPEKMYDSQNEEHTRPYLYGAVGQNYVSFVIKDFATGKKVHEFQSNKVWSSNLADFIPEYKWNISDLEDASGGYTILATYNIAIPITEHQITGQATVFLPTLDELEEFYDINPDQTCGDVNGTVDCNNWNGELWEWKGFSNDDGNWFICDGNTYKCVPNIEMYPFPEDYPEPWDWEGYNMFGYLGEEDISTDVIIDYVNRTQTSNLVYFEIGKQQFLNGCTDPFAINFNEFAIVEDGSCKYRQDCDDKYLISRENLAVLRTFNVESGINILSYPYEFTQETFNFLDILSNSYMVSGDFRFGNFSEFDSVVSSFDGNVYSAVFMNGQWVSTNTDGLDINDLKPGQGFILQVSQPGTISWNPVMLEEEDAG